MNGSSPATRALAYAKVNLSLRVRARDGSGLHPIRSLMQSIDWFDVVEMEAADRDTLEAVGAPVPPDRSNLVWRAVDRLREAASGGPGVTVRLDKQVPPAAGLGGGSADAAAALLLYAPLAGVPGEDLASLAAGVGSDVPFSLQGGLRWVEGHGESVGEEVSGEDFWMALVLPPFELGTDRVYREWDRLGGPEGTPVPGRALPPGLRDLEPFANDLYPAALSLASELDDWRVELERAWGRPVLMSGSGPTLFGLFAGRDEASDGLGVVPGGTRAQRAVGRTGRGVRIG